MRSLIIILTALHVLAHGVFGCCDHGVSTVPQVKQPCACHAHHHHGHHSHRTPPDDEWLEDDSPTTPPHECFHASCHWVAGDAASSIFPPDDSAMIGSTVTLPLDLPALHVGEFRLSLFAGLSAAPPLRLHLALGVILI